MEAANEDDHDEEELLEHRDNKGGEVDGVEELGAVAADGQDGEGSVKVAGMGVRTPCVAYWGNIAR